MSVTRIAAKAGVSIATVSRVLNNSRPVNPQMAELVHKAMEELKLPARQIRRRGKGRSTTHSGTVAIVSLGQGYRDWFQVPVIAGVVGEITRAAQENHLGVLMTEMPDPHQLSAVLRRPEVEGALVFISSGMNPADVKLLRDHLPVVRVMGGQISAVEIDHVGPDNNSIGYLAGRYLVDRGLEQVAYLTTEPHWDFCKLRAQGCLMAAEESALRSKVYVRAVERKVSLRLYGGSGELAAEHDLPALIQRLARERSGRLGLFVSRDEETVQVYRLLQESGVKVGEDVVIVSCDNEAVRLSTLHPRPASIDLNAADIGRHAVRRLTARIKHRDESPVRLLVSPRLVPGESDSDGILKAS